MISCHLNLFDSLVYCLQNLPLNLINLIDVCCKLGHLAADRFLSSLRLDIKSDDFVLWVSDPGRGQIIYPLEHCLSHFVAVNVELSLQQPDLLVKVDFELLETSVRIDLVAQRTVMWRQGWHRSRISALAIGFCHLRYRRYAAVLGKFGYLFHDIGELVSKAIHVVTLVSNDRIHVFCLLVHILLHFLESRLASLFLHIKHFLLIHKGFALLHDDFLNLSNSIIDSMLEAIWNSIVVSRSWWYIHITTIQSSWLEFCFFAVSAREHGYRPLGFQLQVCFALIIIILFGLSLGCFSEIIHLNSIKFLFLPFHFLFELIDSYT